MSSLRSSSFSRMHELFLSNNLNDKDIKGLRNLALMEFDVNTYPIPTGALIMFFILQAWAHMLPIIMGRRAMWWTMSGLIFLYMPRVDFSSLAMEFGLIVER